MPVLVAPCYDSSGAVVGCDPSSTDCVDTNGTPCGNSDQQNIDQGYSNNGAYLAGSVGLAAAGSPNGALSLTVPSAGSGNVGGISTAISSIFANLTSAVRTPSTPTTVSYGSSGLVAGNSLFGNPIMLLALGLLAFMAFKASR